jgi:hypothetical protein
MHNRINPLFLPPPFLVADAVQSSVMCGAKRGGPIVTDFASEGARLGEAEMVGVTGGGR